MRGSKTTTKISRLLFKVPAHGSEPGSAPTSRPFDFAARHTLKPGFRLQISARHSHNSAGASKAEFYLRSQGQRHRGHDKGLQKKKRRSLNAACQALPPRWCHLHTPLPHARLWWHCYMLASVVPAELCFVPGKKNALPVPCTGTFFFFFKVQRNPWASTLCTLAENGAV